jgi:NnrU protein
VASLFAAVLFFVGIHPVISGSGLRGKIVALIGEGPFRGLFSLLSLVRRFSIGKRAKRECADGYSENKILHLISLRQNAVRRKRVT